MRKWIYTGVIAVLFIIAPICDAVASSYSVIYKFTGGSDGGFNLSGLVVDASGALYGTTASTVFKLTPTDSGAEWVETTLYTFEGSLYDCFPGGLAIDSSGALYGTTLYGRNYSSNKVGGYGVVYKLTPPATGQGPWTFAILHKFRGGLDGADPNSIMVGANDVVYGATSWGGYDTKCYGDGCGTIFALIPSLLNKGSYSYRVIHTFTGGRQGDGPEGTLYQDSSGTLYGTTARGGILNSNLSCVGGCGTVFKLMPPTGDDLFWHEETIYRFDGANGTYPGGGVIADSSGALYGTTDEGGSCQNYTLGCGTAFKLSPPLPGRTLWTRDLSYKFEGSTHGYYPNGLTMSSTGVLYGTTYLGGTGRTGTVFSFNQETRVHKVLYSLNVESDGAYPSAGLVAGPDGALYGTTGSGGNTYCLWRNSGITSSCGAVFKVVP
jgi:uncharacterized repeat protein (TIGR03803 family)